MQFLLALIGHSNGLFAFPEFTVATNCKLSLHVVRGLLYVSLYIVFHHPYVHTIAWVLTKNIANCVAAV